MIKPFQDSGYFTVFRNSILDLIMPQCKPNTWKILCATLRQTVGWHREDHLMSVSFYMQATGIASRETCHKAINDAVEKGYLIQIEAQTEHGKGYRYAINRDYEIETPPTYSVTETVTPTVTETVTDTVTETVHKNIKVKKNHKINDDDTKKLFGKVIRAWENQAGSINGYLSERLQDYVIEWHDYLNKLPNSHPDKNKPPETIVLMAIEEMGKHISRPNLKYLDRILHTWKESGINSRNKPAENSPEDYTGGEFADYIES